MIIVTLICVLWVICWHRNWQLRMPFCRSSDAEGDGAVEPEEQDEWIDGIHAFSHAGWVWSCWRRCYYGRQCGFGTALLTDVHDCSAGQLRVTRLHLKHEPVISGWAARACASAPATVYIIIWLVVVVIACTCLVQLLRGAITEPSHCRLPVRTATLERRLPGYFFL